MQIDPGQEPVFSGMMSDPRFAEIGLEFMNRAYIKSVRHETTHTTHPTIHIPFSPHDCKACQPHKQQFLVENPPIGPGARRRGHKTVDLSPDNPGVIHHKPNTRSTKKRKR